MYFKSKWSLLFLFVATWIGLSRIYVGVHYPIDTVGAVFLSVAMKDLTEIVTLKIHDLGIIRE